MGSEYEALKLGVSQKLARAFEDADWSDPTAYDNAAVVVLAYIAERTKEATIEMHHHLLRENRKDPEPDRAIRTAHEYTAGDLAWRAMHAASALYPQPQAIEWRRVNDEPFEYAIRQGPHGDEFVRTADDACLRRNISPPSPADREAYFRVVGAAPEWSNYFGTKEALNEIDSVMQSLTDQLTSICAEGSAECARLEGQIRQHREQISRLQDTIMKLKGDTPETLAQPAESGATAEDWRKIAAEVMIEMECAPDGGEELRILASALATASTGAKP